MPRRVKVFTVILLWITIALSMWLVAQGVVVRAILALVAIGVTTHIILNKDCQRGRKAEEGQNTIKKQGGSGWIQIPIRRRSRLDI